MPMQSTEEGSLFELHEGRTPFFVNTKTVIGRHIENPRIYGEITIPPKWSPNGGRVTLMLWGLWQTHARQSSELPTFLKDQLLAHNTAVVTIDPLGLAASEIGGKSSGSDQQVYSMRQLSYDATKVVQALAEHPGLGLGGENPTAQLFIGGVSLGGATAAWTAAECLRTGISVAGVVGIAAPEHLGSMWRAHFDGYRGGKVKRLQKELLVDEDFIKRGYYFKYVPNDGEPIPTSVNVQHDSEIDGMDRLEFTIPSITCPLLFIGSPDDKIAPITDLKHVPYRLRNVLSDTIIEIPHVNHNLEYPDGSNAWSQAYEDMEAFFSRI